MNTLRISTAIVSAIAISPAAMGTNECDKWKTFGEGLDSIVVAVHVHQGELIAIGGFNAFDAVARWNGESWEQLGEGLNTSGTRATMVTFEGDLVAVGPLALQDSSHVGMVLWDGNTWQAIGEQACSGAVQTVGVVGGELYLGLSNNTECEHHVDGFENPIGGLLHWNGEYWSQVGETELGAVRAIVEYEGDLVISDTINPSIPGFIRRWTGDSWEILGESLGGPVDALVVHEGDLIVGGDFQSIDGLPLQRIARYDGQQWLAMTLGMDNFVRDLHVHDGELYAGGRFETVAENPANRLVRWNNLTWVEFEGGVGTGNNQIYAMTSYQGNLVVAGSFTEVGDGITMNRIAQFDACPEPATGACCTGSGCLPLTAEMCASIGGAYLGDDVACAEGACATCPGDLNLDGVVDVLDLLELLDAWGTCP